MVRLTYNDQVYIRALLVFALLMMALVSLSQSATGEKNAKIRLKDSSTNSSFTQAIANPDLKGTGVNNLLIGKNYRREWTQPITVPVLNLSAMHLKPTKEGGGKQTRSLKVEDQEGNEYSLRSVRKYPEKAIPEELRHTLAEKWVSDGISASYPFGALSMTKFSEATHVPYFKEKLIFIGDDHALGEFQSKFSNTLAEMEESRPSGVDASPKEKIETYDTEEIILQLQKSNKNRVDEMEILRARLLDNFVMDFDRHEGQWKWMKSESGNRNVFIAIPKDHDQVFFTNQGAITKIVSGFIPEIQGFKAKSKNPVTFNRPAINFDNFFLTGLNEQQWSLAIDSLLKQMTDEVIESAMAQQPKEVQQFNAQKIIEQLKKRREYFKGDMMKYYRHLSKVVSIVGSNDAEDFQVYINDNGKVLVTVKDDAGNALYERVFDPAVTKEIRLYGLEGKDHFQVDGSESKIKIRIIGGPGDDQFTNNAETGKVWIYDVDAEKNVVDGSGEVKNWISGNAMNNEFERLGYVFDKKGFGVYSKYEFDGGVYFGASYRIIKQGFRKEPYAAWHELTLARTVAINSWLLRYNADLIKAIGTTDLLIRSEYFSPTSRTNFFGLGNETVFDESNSGGIKYYRARYDLANVSVLGRNHINPSMSVSYGPTFQYFQLRENENEGKYITRLDHTLADDKTLHQSNFYAGGEAQFNLNTKDNEILPARGAAINTTVKTLVPLKGGASTLTQLSTTISFYSDFLAADRLILATRFGVAHNIGDYQFAQAQYLGFRENLRGFRLRRFAGRTSAYNNVEFRWKAADLNLYVFPASFGLFAFNDVGRVWIENEKSSTWHDGYGAGIWLAPLNKLVITGSISYSSEEKNFAMLTFGFQF